ncbi:MAG: MarR family winged helix-turn-helix transcriptional regulator [Candidatus Acetothermia bacterium]
MIKIFTDRTELSSKQGEIALLLYRISQGINKLVREKAQETNLSSAQIQAMIFLSEAYGPHRNVSSIARRLQIAQPTATRVVNSLVQKGLVARQRSTEDRRKVILQVTDEGREISEDLKTVGREVQEVVGFLSDQQQSDLSESLLEIAGELQSRGHLSAALSCQYCKYFERNGGSSEARPHHCRLTGEDLSEEASRSEWVHGEKQFRLIQG